MTDGCGAPAGGVTSLAGIDIDSQAVVQGQVSPQRLRGDHRLRQAAQRRRGLRRRGTARRRAVASPSSPRQATGRSGCSPLAG